METLGSTQVYANPWLAVREHTIRRSDRSTGIYGVVDSPDIARLIGVQTRGRHQRLLDENDIVVRAWAG